MTSPITTPSDHDLTKHSIRTVHDADNNRIVIEVELVHWPHPHKPVAEWVQAAELPSAATQADIDKAVIKVLRRRKFFKVCRECGKRKHSGCMYDRETCPGCAKRTGVRT